MLRPTGGGKLTVSTRSVDTRFTVLVSTLRVETQYLL